MAGKSNVIDFQAFKKNKKIKKIAHEETPEPVSKKQVIPMAERRQEQIAEDKRLVTRTVLSQFIGVFVVLKDQGLQPVSLYDISEGGLAFDLAHEFGNFSIGETVAMRIYLSHDTYFSFRVKVANVRHIDGEVAYRHGTVLLKDDESYKALYNFMKFLENVAKVARKDHGDRMLGRAD